ncbi:MAG: phosphatase PAP2 family protein [Chlamydiae bacterium]|nr:phosphatase PAP2 family protein [Chlamydiota bacterium]MBI3266785.1 phosphatase PAP2 family protein [Chlamydiota bacterium]
MHMLTQWDLAIFHSINQIQSRVLDIFFLWITEFKSFGWFLLVALSTFLSKRKDRWRIALFAVLLLASVNVLSHEVFKPLFHRPRPCHVLQEAIVRTACPDSPSFPSGHAMSIFAIAVFLGFYYPSWVGFLGFLTVAVSLSRIYMGVHYPSDVLGGAILGMIMAFGWRKMEKKSKNQTSKIKMTHQNPKCP